MATRFTEQEYKHHAEETREAHGFTPTWPDLEGRQRFIIGKDEPKIWVGETYRNLKYLPFELPSSETMSTTYNIGSENLNGDKIDPLFPFSQLSITRIQNGSEPDQMVVSLQIFFDTEEKRDKTHWAFINEFGSVRDIAAETNVEFFSRFAAQDRQTLTKKDAIELPPDLAKLVVPKDPPLYPSFKLMRIFDLGERTSGNILAEDGLSNEKCCLHV